MKKIVRFSNYLFCLISRIVRDQKMSISCLVGYLKRKNIQMIFERRANVRFKYRNRTFWRRGYLCRYGKEEFESHWRVDT